MLLYLAAEVSISLFFKFSFALNWFVLILFIRIIKKKHGEINSRDTQEILKNIIVVLFKFEKISIFS